MTFDKFTIKAQEAIQSALDTAKRNGQQTIEPVHILAGVMDKGKDVTDYVLQKLGVNAQTVELSLQNEIKHLPKVSGGEPYFSPDSNKVLEQIYRNVYCPDNLPVQTFVFIIYPV